MQTLFFRSNGKLMITGEYLVLAGARALAMPVRHGQWVRVDPLEGQERTLHWKSLVRQKPWLEMTMDTDTLELMAGSPNTSDTASIRFVQQALRAARKLNPAFLRDKHGWIATANLEFDKGWGFGSSSSLISNIAYWAETDPYDLFYLLSKGSGYDLACARSQKPIVYTFTGHAQKPVIQEADFNPPFRDHLFFVYSGKKQDSAASIARFDARTVKKDYADTVSRITDHIVTTTDLQDFIQLLQMHESVISKATGLNPLQGNFFPDFPGVIKSSGAWGGDFFLAAADLPPEEIKTYFLNKDMHVIFAFQDLIIKPNGN